MTTELVHTLTPRREWKELARSHLGSGRGQEREGPLHLTRGSLELRQGDPRRSHTQCCGPRPPPSSLATPNLFQPGTASGSTLLLRLQTGPPLPPKKPCDARYPSILHPRNLRQVGQWIRTPPPLHPSYYPRGNPSCRWSFTQGDAGPHLPAARPTLSPPAGLPVPPPGHHLPPSTGFQSRHFLHTNPARPASESAPRLLQSVH